MLEVQQSACACNMSATTTEGCWQHQVRRALDSRDPVRRRLGSEQACNISRKGSCQLSDTKEQPRPPDILLQIAGQELPGGSADACSGPWGSCHLSATHSEEQLTEVTSPRKAQPLPTDAQSRQDELVSLLSIRNLLSQEACAPNTGTWTAHPARELLPSGQQVIVGTDSALAAGSVAQTQGAVREAMQHAGPVPADVDAVPGQHASAAGPGGCRQALGINPHETAERLDGAHGQMGSGGSLRTSGSPAGTVSRPQAALLPFCRTDLACTGSERQPSRLDHSTQLPQADHEQGSPALCRDLSEQKPVGNQDSEPVQQQLQTAGEPPIDEAEVAMRSFRSRIWQQGMLPDAPTANTSRSPVKQGAPLSPRAATQAGLARLAHLACLPAAAQKSEASSGLAPDRGKRPLSAAQGRLLVVPPGTASMPPLMSRQRSACSPSAAAMQCSPDSTPPPAWGNTF